MDRNSVNWYGSITAVVTPFYKDGEIDINSYTQNVELCLEAGVHGIVVTGCTGEAWALTDREKLLLAKRTVEVVRKRVPVISGTTSISPSDVIALSKECIKAGVDGIMVSAPYDCLPSQDEIYEHFKLISDELKFPMLVYNIPSRLGVNLSVQLMDRLAELESVVAIKQSSKDYMDVFNTIKTVSDRLRVIVGYSSNRGLPCMALGADGFTSTSDLQVLGKPAVELYNAYAEGDMVRARVLQELCFKTASAVSAAGTFPASLKSAMNLVGRPGGYPRRPLLPVAGAKLEKLASDLAALNLKVSL
ncbi:MAG: dihydrodipicolinate synthase family protein [Clostridia bacterium]|nr:dihydrodipicolinate synthase family protein [Clostridia bacterium]